MKRIKRIYLICLLLLANIGSMQAQFFNSSYFLEGMPYRHELNPSFMYERNYINMPLFVLGNLNVGLQGNVGVSDFLYPYNRDGYQLTTFMNPMVDAQEFLGGLNPMNRLGVNLDMPIVALGLRSFGGFSTVAIKLRSHTHINLPYGLFEFLKLGMYDENGSVYRVDDLSVHTNNYVEVGLGHAHALMDNQLQIGAKVKFLLGGANADAHIRNMNIRLSQDVWDIEAEGELQGSLKGAEFETKEPNDAGQREVSGLKVNNPGIAGFGLGFDLGAQYHFQGPLEGLNVSASLLDLGFIRWNSSVRANMQQHYTFKGFQTPIEIDGGKNEKLEDEIDQIGEDMKEFIRFYDNGITSGRTTKLATTMNVGVEYALPWYKNLTFGLLSSTYFNKPFTWTEARLSANVAPLKWLEVSANYAVNRFGSSFGYVINFHPKGFNVFLGMDHLTTRYTPQCLPVNDMNFNVCVGFNVTWGK